MAHLAFFDDDSSRKSSHSSVSVLRRAHSCRTVMTDSNSRSITMARGDTHKSSSSLSLAQYEDDLASVGRSAGSFYAACQGGASKGTIKKTNRVFRQQLNHANQTIEELRRQAQEDKEKFERELAKARSRAKRLGSDKKEVQKQHHKEMVGLQKELKRANKAQERLKKDLLAAQGRNVRLESNIRDLNNQHCRHMSDLQSSLNYSLQESRRLKRVECSLKKELSKTRDRLRQAEDELEDFRPSGRSVAADFCWSPRSPRLLTEGTVYEDEVTCTSSDDISDSGHITSAPFAGPDKLRSSMRGTVSEREVEQETVIQNLMKQIKDGDLSYLR